MTDPQSTRKDCAFCGEPFGPARKRTGEHAWAQWLGELIPNEGEPIRHTIRTGGLEGPILGQWETKELSVVANQVCKPCNNEWMNDLENDAKPYLATLVRGRGRTLYSKGQTALAAWATKTVYALRL